MKKELKHITVETLPNGYSLEIVGRLEKHLNEG